MKATRKAFENSHKNLLTNIKQVSELLNFHKEDVILKFIANFSLFRINGYNFIATLRRD